ncbi:MAG: phosphatase PAP2 family protein [Gemmatimonadota bacterium]|nr:MAG: phosphatase PAP2 family protein [Gemmatimonadota bacterium]
MSEATAPTRPYTVERVWAIIGIVLLHITCYYIVNLTNSHRGGTAFVDLAVPLDRWIPYLGWSWVIYYFGDVYITLWAAVVFWQIPRHRSMRAVQAYCGTIVLGAIVQLLVPARAPWPESPVAVQQWMHQLISMRPYACLPSMHVALAVLPAGIAVSVLESHSLRAVSVVLAVAITVSTLTMKEHFFLDAVAGIVLGLAAYVFWRGGRPLDAESSLVEEGHDVCPT